MSHPPLQARLARPASVSTNHETHLRACRRGDSRVDLTPLWFKEASMAG